MQHRPHLTALAAVLLAGISSFAAQAASPAVAAPAPVVIELFTSQGCSSCPPADAVLAEAAKRDGVIALAWHVDYWNQLGWKDPYASATATNRQRAYRDAFKLRNIYTPQAVIQGSEELVGSEGAGVQRAIDRARSEAKIPVVARWNGDGTLAIELPAGSGSGTVRIVTFDRGHMTDVRAGENAGRKLGTTHPVSSTALVGDWNGKAAQIVARPTLGDDAQGVAILLQDAQLRVLGAAMVERPS